MRPRHLVLACCLLALVLTGRAHPQSTETIALVGGRIVTQSDAGTIERGTIVVRNGKISAVGTEVDIPAGARRIDITGLTVTPGMIDARSSLWLSAAARSDGATDARLNVLDGIDIDSEDWREVARQGVTSVYVQPAASGNLGGAGAVLRVAPAQRVADLIVLAPAAAQAAIGVGSRGTSRSRYSQYDRIRRALDAAKKYGEQKDKAAGEPETKQDADGEQKDKAAGEPEIKQDADGEQADGNTAKAGQEAVTKAPASDRAKDFLLEVLAGKIPVRLEAHRQDDIEHAMKLAGDYNLRLILDGATSAASVADLATARTPRVLGPIVELEGTADYRSGRPPNWLTASIAGEPAWALASFGRHPRASRLLRVQAAAAIAAGAKRDDVLRAVTSHAADLLQVGDQLGRIAPGFTADVSVFAGDPLDPSTSVRLVLSKGQITYENARATQRPEVIRSTITFGDALPPAFAIKSQRMCFDGSLTPGVLVIRDGSIVAAGPQAPIPADVPLFDLGNAVVTPGLVSAADDLGQAAAASDQFAAVSAYLRATDAFDPEAARARELLRNGFVQVAMTPGRANVVAGRIGSIRLGAPDPIDSAHVASQLDLTSQSRKDDRYPASLAGQLQLIDAYLSGDSIDSRLYIPDAVKRELAIAAKVRGDEDDSPTIMIHAEQPAELNAALVLIEQFGIRANIVGPRRFDFAIERMKQAGVGIIATPVAVAENPQYIDDLVAAADAGIAIAFGSGTPDQIRTTAALLVEAGMPADAVLSGLTQIGAELTTIGSGRLTAGAHADFVVWDGNPVNLASRPIAVVVDGRRIKDQ